MARAFLFGPRASAPATARAAAAAPQTAASAGASPSRPLAPSRGETQDATPEVLAAAFHYRGDVTLELADGSRVEGFVSNLGDAHVELWLRRSVDVRRIPRDSILRVAFSGRDTALSGRSRLPATPDGLVVAPAAGA
jgi:hypothetical protein